MKKPFPSTWLAAGLLLLIVLAAAAWWLWLRTPPLPEGLVQASGRIEGRITTVSSKVAGRVVELPIDEGQKVAADTLLARLEDAALQERVRAADENLNTLGHRLRAAENQLALLTRQVPLQIGHAEAGGREARARAAKSHAEYEQAERDAERAVGLAGKNFISEQRVEAARLAAETRRSAWQEGEAALAQAKQQLALARLGGREVGIQAAARDALRAQMEQARAALAEQKSQLAELAIASPLAGIVLTRNVEPGERINPGQPLFTVVDLDRLYLKVYVPETDIGKFALGEEARVFVDAYPDRFFPARLSKVASQAEFTPKQVETREERVKLVFAVELAITENPGGVLKPGMPADAVIRWQKDAPWAKRR